MIKIIKKDIITVTKGIVAHGCNCLGVMGAGVALAIARKWPMVLNDYKVFLSNYGKDYHRALGDVQLALTDNPDVMVANCFTQIGVGFDPLGNPPASLTAIETSLRKTINGCNINQLDLYTPQIGCGLGGLDWAIEVKPLYEALEDELDDGLNWYVCTI